MLIKASQQVAPTDDAASASTPLLWHILTGLCSRTSGGALCWLCVPR